MTSRVALLLDDAENPYQKLLVHEARTAAVRCDITVLEPEFAAGSSWTQVESVNRHLRETRPDGVLLMLAGSQWTRGPFERLCRGGVPVVLLNRVPDWVDGLRHDHPQALIAAVTPRQEGVGALQGQLALRLARPGTLVLLVTGEASSPAAIGRTRGFSGAVADKLQVVQVDGHWSARGAEEAVAEWFRLGAERDHSPGLVVCQNDAMAGGARRALRHQAASSGRRDLESVGFVGCDGLAEEGRGMVARGELAATVVMPPTTPAALDILQRFWSAAERPATVLLEATTHPALEDLPH